MTKEEFIDKWAAVEMHFASIEEERESIEEFKKDLQEALQAEIVRYTSMWVERYRLAANLRARCQLQRMGQQRTGARDEHPPDDIDRELAAFGKIPDWGCPCGAEGPHEWMGFSVPRRGFWGMCPCKGGEPHLHMLMEMINKAIPFPSMEPR